MTTASEEVPAEEGLGPADLLAAQRAVARRLRQAGGVRVLDLRHLSIGGTGTGGRPVDCERGVRGRAGWPLAPERRAAPPTIPGLSSPIRATTSSWRSPCRST